MNHTIKISINANGMLSYSHQVLVVKPGHTVRWVCKKPYAIQFADNKDPFEPSAKFSYTPEGGYTRKYQVKKKSKGARKSTMKETLFKYTVVVFVGGARHVLIDDPHIIIDEGP